MAPTDQFFTLVVHSPQRADRLREILEFHGIKVELADFPAGQCGSAPMAKEVRIPFASLELGLKILESGQMASAPAMVMKMTGMSNILLIPVDFSPASLLAVKIGFSIAQKFNCEPVVLHSYIVPTFPSEPYDDEIDGTGEMVIAEEVQEGEDVYKICSRQLAKFKAQIEKAQKEGTVPDIHFSTSLIEGIPEQVIEEYCRQNKPVMVVMATRGINKKESDLIGSVTAEVIDSCRVPVFTVPEECHLSALEKIKNIIIFCTLTPIDIVNVRALMRTFDYPAAKVWLLPASERPLDSTFRSLDDLANAFSQSYPTAEFAAAELGKGKFEASMKAFLASHDVQLIIVPNKKSSAFSRFFRPTLAHKILFEKDIPLLVLPV